MSDCSSGGFAEGPETSGSSCLLSVSVTAELLSGKQRKAHVYMDETTLRLKNLTAI